MKFFIDPKLFPNGEKAARRAAARFQCRFGIGPDSLNEQFPPVEREAIVAFLRQDEPPPVVQTTQATAPTPLEPVAPAEPLVANSEVFQPKPDDAVLVTALGIEGTVVAVKGTTITVALDGVTEDFRLEELASASTEAPSNAQADVPAPDVAQEAPKAAQEPEQVGEPREALKEATGKGDEQEGEP